MARHFGTMGAAPVGASLPSGLTIAEMGGRTTGHQRLVLTWVLNMVPMGSES